MIKDKIKKQCKAINNDGLRCKCNAVFSGLCLKHFLSSVGHLKSNLREKIKQEYEEQRSDRGRE